MKGCTNYEYQNLMNVNACLLYTMIKIRNILSKALKILFYILLFLILIFVWSLIII